MPIDASIPLQIQQPQPFQRIGELLNVARNSLAYQRDQQTFDADVSQRNAESSSAQSRATVDSANVQPLIQQQAANTSQAQTGAQKAQFGLHKDYTDTALQTATGLLNDPRIANTDPTTYDPGKATQALLEAKKQMIARGVPEIQAEVVSAPFVNAVHQPGAVQNLLKRTLAAQLTPESQANAAAPSGIGINNGAGGVSVNTNPLAALPIGAAIPGTQYTAKPPPTTPAVGPHGEPGIIGANPAAAPGGVSSMRLDVSQPNDPNSNAAEIAKTLQSLNTPGLDDKSKALLQQHIRDLQGQAQRYGQTSGFMQTGLAPGQAENMGNSVDLMNKHYAERSGLASDAQLALGLTSNIKTLASGAATGTEAGRRAYLNGMLNALHLGNQSTGDIQKDTDLLEKNLAQLNLSSPASTDAARTLISAARPHSTMSESAIRDAADQVASQVQANLAVRNYLTPYKFANGGKGDPQGYQQARQQIEEVADPRAWQYVNLKPGSPEAKAFIKGKPELVHKIDMLEQMGLIK